MNISFLLSAEADILWCQLLCFTVVQVYLR